MTKVPAKFFYIDQTKKINEAFKKLFGVSMEKEGDSFVFPEKAISEILETMPEIRKWQIGYILFREKMYKEGIKLSKDTLRELVWNQEKVLKDYGIDPEETIEIFEGFVRESMDRVFKKNKQEEE